MNTRPILDRSWHRIAGFGPPLFFTIATIEGAIRTGYDPIAQPISALALGPRGWIQEVNFVLLAASFLSFAVVLRRQLRDGAASVVATGLFVLLTIGVSVAAIFPMDAGGAPPTLVGRLHVAGGFLVFPWMPVVLLVLAARFRRDPEWRPFFRYTLATGMFCLATITFFLLFVGPPGSPPRIASGLAGLVQRLQLIAFFTWMALFARRAYQRQNAGFRPPAVREGPPRGLTVGGAPGGR